MLFELLFVCVVVAFCLTDNAETAAVVAFCLADNAETAAVACESCAVS